MRLACLALVSLCPFAQADLITWGTVQTVSSPLDVMANGVLVTARNTWANAFAQPTVNGVTFDAYAPPGWNNGGWSLLAGSFTGDSEYDALLDSARATSEPVTLNPTDWGGIRLDTLGTLDIGSQYLIQVWYSDQRLGTPTNTLFDRVMTFSSATGAATQTGGIVTNLANLTQGTLSGGLDADPNDSSGPQDAAIGSYVVGTFTRTSTDPLWLLVQGTHPVATETLRAHINGFQIREVVGTSLGSSYCIAAPNSTGNGASMFGQGSTSVSFNSFTVQADPIPAFANLIFYYGPNQIAVPFGDGFRCIAGATSRLPITSASAAGVASYTLDLTSPPNPLGLILPGSTWNFQAWYRDPNGPGGTGFNLSDGLQINFTN